MQPVQPVQPEQPGKQCVLGLPDEDGSVCCPESCGTCGGKGCGGRKGGMGNCCRTIIMAAGESCLLNRPPCVNAPPENWNPASCTGPTIPLPESCLNLSLSTFPPPSHAVLRPSDIAAGFRESGNDGNCMYTPASTPPAERVWFMSVRSVCAMFTHAYTFVDVLYTRAGN